MTDQEHGFRTRVSDAIALAGALTALAVGPNSQHAVDNLVGQLLSDEHVRGDSDQLRAVVVVLMHEVRDSIFDAAVRAGVPRELLLATFEQLATDVEAKTGIIQITGEPVTRERRDT